MKKNIVNGIVLAAGLSSRMKKFKPLMKIGEKSIIEHTVDQMINAGVEQIVVVLGYRGSEIEQKLNSSKTRENRLQFVYNSEFETTHMLDSIKIGLEKLNFCNWFFITPGDMPAISTTTYEFLMKSADNYSGKAIFPLLSGQRKHPPLISWKCKNDISSFIGNGLRELWKLYETDILEIAVEDKGCSLDVDFPEDYQKVFKYLEKNFKI